MNAEEIQAGLALCEKATPPPWRRCAHLEKAPCGCGGNHGFMYGPGEGDAGHILDMHHEEDRRDADDETSFHCGMQLPSREQVLANAAFIEAARTLLPRALSALEACQRERDSILNEARVWADEAKAQRATVNEVGQSLGGRGDWTDIAKQVRTRIVNAEYERDRWKALAECAAQVLREDLSGPGRDWLRRYVAAGAQEPGKATPGGNA